MQALQTGLVDVDATVPGSKRDREAVNAQPHDGILHVDVPDDPASDSKAFVSKRPVLAANVDHNHPSLVLPDPDTPRVAQSAILTAFGDSLWLVT